MNLQIEALDDIIAPISALDPEVEAAIAAIVLAAAIMFT